MRGKPRHSPATSRRPARPCLSACNWRGSDIARALKKADDAFYSVTFASKGSGQLTAIYNDAKAGVDLALREFDAVLGLLASAGAPGVS